MMNRNRRDFLADVGKGMLIAGVGATVATELGLSRAFAADGTDRLTFGDREPLVSLLQDTPAAKLLPILATKVKDGTSLESLVAAGALANARTFGGQDYDGYHAFMALLPAFQMSRELPAERRALPVLKVLYRNTTFMQNVGGSKKEVLHAISPADLPKAAPTAEELREATRKRDVNASERAFAAIAKEGAVDDAFNSVVLSVQDEVDVHRTVLAWRAWAILDLVGKEQAHTVLRQSVRFCIHEGRKTGVSEISGLLPKLLDQFKLIGRTPGKKTADDAWVQRLADTIYGAPRPKAAEAVAGALADGIAPDVIGEAMSLAATKLVQCMPTRRKDQAQPGKPEGSIHGAGVGVHGADACNAWRNIARVSNARNAFASLIVGAYHTAGQSGGLLKEPPQIALMEKITEKDASALLRDAEGSIKEKNLDRTAALIQRYGELGHDPRKVFDLMLRYSISEDGALHAEKYYRTVSEDFASTRPSFRWRHLVALSRVVASEYGFPAPGYKEACELLNV